jgi:phosphoglycolate phosphatase-like HAD superfamily hydrolase
MRIFLFDIDGTLISSGGAGKAAMEAALAAEFGITEPSQQIPFSGRTDRAIAQDLLRAHGLDDGPQHWKRFLAAYLRHLPATLASHQGRILPGISALLEHLGAQPGQVLGLLTGNIREGARLKLGHYRLFHHFVLGGYGDQHVCRNDVAREALAAVQCHLNCAPSLEHVWVIGDTPLDIQCARAINARVAAVATGWHSLEELAAAKPDLLLADFSDPEPLMRALRNGG